MILYKGHSKSYRLTQLITRYVRHILSLFWHRFLQLKCTWSGISPKLGFHSRRTDDLSPSGSHLPRKRRFPPQNCPSHGGIWTPSKTWFIGPIWSHIPNGISIGSAVFAALKIVINWQTDHATSSVTTDCIYTVVRCGLIIRCTILQQQTVLTSDAISIKFIMSFDISLWTFWTPTYK